MKIADSLTTNQPIILAAALGSFRGELIGKVASYLDMHVAEWFLFGHDALEPGLPELATTDPIATGLRQLMLAAGVAEADLPEPTEELVAMPPG